MRLTGLSLGLSRDLQGLRLKTSSAAGRLGYRVGLARHEPSCPSRAANCGGAHGRLAQQRRAKAARERRPQEYIECMVMSWDVPPYTNSPE